MRILVIASGDYGEFGTAMYLLEGLRGHSRLAMLLPASLAHTRVVLPGVDIRTFTDLAGIRAALDDVRPDAVVLTSGYLLPINSGLTLLDTARLSWLLARRRVTVLTSDPFVGLLRSRALDFSGLQGRGRIPKPGFAASWRFALPLFVARHLLRGACHIYPVPVDGLRAARQARRMSFYNEQAAAVTAAHAPGNSASKPTWLFVVSSTELALQLAMQGDEFVANLSARLADGAALGREVILIGPAGLVAAVKQRLGDRPGITARTQAPYAEYMTILLGAEYVFFWNFFSFSIIHRVLAERPVFYFHEGHMVHILPALGQEGVRVVYGGWRPPLLGLGATLDERELAERSIEVRREFARIAAGMRKSHSPRELLERASAPA